MGASKNQFQDMREQERQEFEQFNHIDNNEEIQETNHRFQIPIFDSTFTKKEAKQTGENLIIQSIESGEIGKFELMANLVRLQEVINSAVGKLREELPYQDMQTMGVKFSTRDGGSSANYGEDPIYADLQNQLKQREEQLKLAIKTDCELYDSDGILVPRVSTTPRKSSISISF